MTIDVGRLEARGIADLPADDTTAPVASLVELVEAQRATIESLRAAVVGHQARRRDRARARKAFAHEVATPLTAVLGLLELLGEGANDLAPEERAAIVDRATRQATHLRATVEDFLDAPAEEVVPIRRAEMTPVDLADLVQDVVDGVAGGIGDAGVDDEVPPGLRIATAPSRLRQILTNLVVNARRHGGGRVKVTASRTVDAVVIDIADRGPGVPPELVESLFQPFVQGPGAPDRGGVGLGLYLVRRLTGSLGGTVSLFPNLGGGTVARVVLPQQRDEDELPAMTVREGS